MFNFEQFFLHFDILMFHYIQIKKSCAFQVCAIVVLQLHTAGTEDPITPQTHLGASISLNTTQIPPQIPSRHLQRSQDVNRQQHAPTDTSRHTQTAPDSSVRGCLEVSVYVCWHLFSFVDFLSSPEMSGGV